MTGELAGRGLESSLNVEVGMKSRKRWKRAGIKSKGTEFMCKEHWMAMGNSNSSFADLS